MKVFLSWSGEQSKAIASALSDWLPEVIQSLEPWYSAKDIEVGDVWQEKLIDELKAPNAFAVLCVTRENLDSRWLHFEAGAFLRSLPKPRIACYLHDLKPSDIKPPLSMFQATTCDREGTESLLTSLHSSLGDPRLPVERVLAQTRRMWGEMKKRIEAVPSAKTRTGKDAKAKAEGDIRSDRDLLEEVLGRLRSQAPIARTVDASRFQQWSEQVSLGHPSARFDAGNLTTKIFLDRFYPGIVERLLGVINSHSVAPDSKALQAALGSICIDVAFEAQLPHYQLNPLIDLANSLWQPILKSAWGRSSFAGTSIPD